MLQMVTKAEAVYLETRASILTGALLPGLQVNQEALAARPRRVDHAAPRSASPS